MNTVLRAIAIAIVCPLLTSSAALAQDQQALSAEQREQLLASGEHAELIAWFKANPDVALPWVDSYLEGGLAMIEKGESAQEARASMDVGVRLGKLAAAAFNEPRFADYTAAFAGWDADQQNRFREGQQLVGKARRAMAEEDAEQAMRHATASLARAEPLGDWWGMGMAHGAIGQAAAGMDDHEKAAAHLATSADIYRSLRLRTGEASMRADLVLSQVELGALDDAAESMTRLDAIAREDDRLGVRIKVTEARRAYTFANAMKLREQWNSAMRDVQDITIELNTLRNQQRDQERARAEAQGG